MGIVPSQTADDPDGVTEDMPRGPAPRTTRSHLICLSRAHNKFTVSLYQEMAKDGKRPNNIMISPLCIGVGFGMVYIGARRHTLEELYKAFHIDEVQEYHLLPAYAAMHWDLLRSAMPKGCDMEIAIRLFSSLDVHMVPLYEETCVNYEIFKIKNLDFANRPDLAKREICKWVEERTQGRIKDVIPGMGVVDRDTKLFLMCAIYLHVQWYHPFDPKKTVKMAFYLPMKETLEVLMMNQQQTFKVGTLQKLDCDVIELPFSNVHIKMYIFLPRKEGGIQKIESKLSRTMIETVEDHLKNEYIDVYIPKFKYEIGFIPKEMLSKVGIKDIFTPNKADLSGISGSKDIFLNNVFHYVIAEFDESGNDEMRGVNSTHDVARPVSSEMRPQRVIKCDRPFFFYLRDERTGAVIFIGRVVRPELA